MAATNLRHSVEVTEVRLIFGRNPRTARERQFAHLWEGLFSESVKHPKGVGNAARCYGHAPDSAGLNSIAWRYEWESTKDEQVKNRLITYNLDDCHALRRLLTELKHLGVAACSRLDVDFADRPRTAKHSAGTSDH